MPIAAVVAAVIVVGAVTALVFLVRAGDIGDANWPVTWNLRSSDNGVLFQVMQDVVAGRRLDWSFSPQVFIFPELPVSAIAFFLAGGRVYGYYIFVAALNNALLFLAIFGVLRMLHPIERVGAVLARAGLAAVPLVALPLVGTSWLLSYQLAPTYYFGMYLMVFAAPMLFLAKTPWVRIVLGAAIALTAASNPLALVFSFPAFACVLVVWWIRHGFRSALRPAVAVVGILILALVVRVVLFSSLQGTSPLTYVNATVFAGRLAAILPYFATLALDPSSGLIYIIGALLAVVCLVGAGIAAGVYLRRRPADDRLLAAVYLGLVPLAGLAGTFVLMITHYLYFWLVLIAPFIVILMAVPRGWALRLLPVGVAGLLVIAVVTGAGTTLANDKQYFGYRDHETQCLDSQLPPGATLGYATFSDARRLSLTSDRPFRLIQLLSGGTPAYWLTNRAYAKDEAGTFFYINRQGDEMPIDSRFLTEHFGQPDSTFNCGVGQSVMVYSQQSKLDAIATYYRSRTP